MEQSSASKHVAIAGLFLGAGLASWWMIRGQRELRAWALHSLRVHRPIGGSESATMPPRLLLSVRDPEAADKECIRIFRSAMDESIRLQRENADAFSSLLKQGPLAVPESSDGQWALSKMNQVLDLRSTEKFLLEVTSSRSAGVIGNVRSFLFSEAAQGREEAFNFEQVAKEVDSASGDHAAKERLRATALGNAETRRKIGVVLLDAYGQIGKL